MFKVVMDSLKVAVHMAVPRRTVKLHGPRFRASPVVRDMFKKVQKYSHQLESERVPGPDNVYYAERKTAKKNLRQPLRRENFNCKEHFYNNLMNNPDSQAVHRLIRMNQSDRSNSSTCLTLTVKILRT